MCRLSSSKLYYRQSLLCFLLLVTTVVTVRAQEDTVTIRYKRHLFQYEQPTATGDLIRTYDPARQWPDINYLDTERAGWQVLKHLQRIRDMAIAWANPLSPSFHSNAYHNTINAALQYWLYKRPQNSNWWHNQIGVPKLMRDVIILLRDTLTSDQLKQSLEVVAQYKLQPAGAGANLIWSADIGLHYAVLTHNDTLARRCRTLLVNEINITTGDGIQPDYSFHQHGARLQMYQYGSAFLLDNIRLAWQLKGTGWAYPPEKTAMLANLVLQGWQWMARGMNTVPGTMDRSATRVGALQNADIRSSIPYLCELYPAGAKALLAIADFQNGKGQPLKGFRYFPYSDFSTYQHKAASFFIKTISDRTLATESINSENLKGHLLNSGDTYVIQNGREYADLVPCWDWERLPGITSFKGADKILRRPFTGSITDGKKGFTVMDYCMQGKQTQTVVAKKLWAFHNGTMICLVAGLQKQHTEEDVFTVLNQCRWQGDVTTNLEKKPLPEGDHHLTNVKWMRHDGIGYFFPQPATIDMSLRTVTGTWSSINASGPTQPVTEKIFNPVLLHRVQDNTPVSTSYMIAACTTTAQLQALSAKPSWRILRNDSLCQAIRLNDGTVMIAFYTAGSLVIGKKKLSANKPCLLMITGDTLYASDPSQKQKNVTVQFGNRVLSVAFPSNFTTTAILLHR